MSSRTYTMENRVYPKDEHGHTSVMRSYVESVDTFTFSVYPGNNNLLTVTKNGTSKTVTIEDCRGEYVYKLTNSPLEFPPVRFRRRVFRR